LSPVKATTKKTGKSRATRRRNPEQTRELLLESAGKLLAENGPEGLSVSDVVKQAGVNRGTAYHHFETREQLLEATMEWVSQRLCEETFGDGLPDDWDTRENSRFVVDRIVGFVMENPELGSAWLHRAVMQGEHKQDIFWQQFNQHMEKFATTDFAEPDIDIEVNSFMMIVGLFMWPLWVRSRSCSAEQRSALVERFKKEVLRLSLHGTVRVPISSVED